MNKRFGIFFSGLEPMNKKKSVRNSRSNQIKVLSTWETHDIACTFVQVEMTEAINKMILKPKSITLSFNHVYPNCEQK